MNHLKTFQIGVSGDEITYFDAVGPRLRIENLQDPIQVMFLDIQFFDDSGVTHLGSQRLVPGEAFDFPLVEKTRVELNGNHQQYGSTSVRVTCFQDYDGGSGSYSTKPRFP